MTIQRWGFHSSEVIWVRSQDGLRYGMCSPLPKGWECQPWARPMLANMIKSCRRAYMNLPPRDEWNKRMEDLT